MKRYNKLCLIQNYARPVFAFFLPPPLRFRDFPAQTARDKISPATALRRSALYVIRAAFDRQSKTGDTTVQLKPFIIILTNSMRLVLAKFDLPQTKR